MKKINLINPEERNFYGVSEKAAQKMFSRQFMLYYSQEDSLYCLYTSFGADVIIYVNIEEINNYVEVNL